MTDERRGWARVRATLHDLRDDQVARVTRIAAWVLVAGAVLLVPWAVLVYVELPSRVVAHQYDVAWAGFDLGLVATMLTCAHALVRRSRMMPIATSALGALLLVDAWFDIVMSRVGVEMVVAVVLSVVIEIPAAIASFWLAYHGQQLREG